MRRGHRGKVDSNQAEIVKVLRAVGATVQSIAEVGYGTPDILVGHRRRTYLLEIKKPGEKANANELQWHARWRGMPVHVVFGPADALRAIGAFVDISGEAETFDADDFSGRP